MKWEIYSFDSLTDPAIAKWQEINERVLGSHPGLDGQFIGLLLQHFGDGSELIAIARENGKDIACAVVKHSGYGIWDLYLPGQACMSPIIFQHNDGPRVVKSLLRALPGFCWHLRMQKIDPLFQALDAKNAFLPLESAEYGTTFSITTTDNFDAYWNGRGKRLKQKFRRLFRDIESASIEQTLTMDRESDGIVNGISIHANIESAGWKGQNGSAIAVDNVQGQFYRDLLLSFSKRHHAMTFQLRFDGEPVASLLCVASGRMMVVLKTTYVESFSPFSPGRLIDHLALQEMMPTSDFDLIEMYTRASPSDLSWATESREIVDVDVYRYHSIKMVAAILRKFRKSSAQSVETE